MSLPKSSVREGMGHALGFRGLEASINAERLNRILFISDTAQGYGWNDTDATKVLWMNLLATAIQVAKPRQKDGLYTYVAVDWDPRIYSLPTLFDEYVKPWNDNYECWALAAKSKAGDAWMKDPIQTFLARTSFLTVRGYDHMLARFVQWAGPIASQYFAIMGVSTPSSDGVQASKEAKKEGGVRIKD